MPVKVGRSKVAKVMREFHAGELRHGGSGKVVRRAEVAKAIAMSEGRRAAGKAYGRKR